MSWNIEDVCVGLVQTTGALFVAALAAFIIYCGWGAVLGATGQIEFCYVAGSRDAWVLHGHREWDPDVAVGEFHSLDDAIAAAAKLGCPLNSKGKK